jgi:transglutaminase-like putative cysteine protease
LTAVLRLAIRHRTTYPYAAPVAFGRHRLVLRPREGHDLRIVDMTLAIEPAHAITWVRDVYGNSLALVDFSGAADRLDIVNEVTIERLEPFPEKRFHEPWLVAFPVPYAAEELPVVDGYRRLSFPDEAADLQRWVEDTVPRRADDAEGMLLELCRLLHGLVAYRRRTEKGVQTPLETLRAGSGSCRDVATLMMDAARVLGIAARFASGYLHAAASIAGHAATHAWTEAYLPGLGWRGFDPTIGKPCGLAHVATGVSQHPRGVMPVSGSFTGERKLFLRMDVEVGTRELTGGTVNSA